MLKTWFIALRPWSFTASFMPISLGLILALKEGYFQPFLFFLTLIGGLSMHAGTNLINTYGDFMSGVDTEESALTCPQLVKNILRPRDMQLVGIGFFAFAFLIGMYLVKIRGPLLFLIGILGIIGGYGYTDGIAYKYKGLGVILVFFLMGPMMVWGAYFVQTGLHSWLPVWASLPLAFLVSAIMHSNDFRDIDHDQKAGIKTFAIIIGKKASFYFCCFLNLAAVFSLIFLIIYGFLPPIALLPLFSLSQLWRVIKGAWEGAKGNRKKLNSLEGEAVKLHFKFGSLYLLAMLINLYL